MALPIPILLLSLGLAGCGDKDPAGDSGAVDADADADTDTDTDAGSDTGEPDGPIHSVSVEVDPDVATMLWVSWTLGEETEQVWLSFTDADGGVRTSPPRAGDVGPHEEVVLGLPAETATTVQIVGAAGGETTVLWEGEASTGALPTAALQPIEVVWDEAAASDAPYMMGTVEINDVGYYWGPFWLFIVDRAGRILWYRELDGDTWTLFPQLARDGTHLVYERGRFVGVFDGAETFVDRSTLSGRYHEVTPMDALGFTFAELPDGSLLYDDYSQWPDLWLTEVAPDGSRREIWNCREWIGDRCSIESCCSANAVKWIEETDRVLWSMFESDTVVEVDRATGEVHGVWGMLDGAWAFDPPDAGLDKQHWPEITDAGTLLLSTHTVDAGEQRWREYTIDREAETLRQVWAYGDAETPYADHHGEAVRLDNGNTLGNFGSGGTVREVTPAGETAWELVWERPYMLGHQELIDDLYALDAGPGAD